ncbi:MAG: hypothetical protein E7633_06025 [Ruminococcaceae bacterium]|nr:hypothetical protein [Oscillospiraceae bacterium]
MNRKDEKLFDAIGYIDSDIIESAADALSGKKKYKKPVLWYRVLAVSVLSVLVVGALLVSVLNIGNDPTDDLDGGEINKNPWYDNLEERPNDSPGDTTEDTPENDKQTDTDSEPEKCPDCGKPVDECECEEESATPYSPFTCPTSSSTVYGVTTENNALTFNDVWGSWEVITEGDLAGSVHATADGGANIGLITGVDFTKAKKVTISADFLLPEKVTGNNNYGFILDVWAEPGEDTFFYWEADFNSYYYCLQSGGGDTGTLLGKWGAGTVLGGEANGWTSFGDAHGVESPATEGLEFRYGKWTNLKVVWDVENDAIEMYYDGQLTKKVDFDETTFKFTNDGDNGVGIRSNRGDVYYKNINLVVE